MMSKIVEEKTDRSGRASKSGDEKSRKGKGSEPDFETAAKKEVAETVRLTDRGSE
ncbi:hypothetical protein [Candidatus Phyllobacterium onerii]|uniref:hypothetical protein n=1 Tax=Candidatus Phyllobacterium onerii TaxID=3020828 RepID=UPI0023313743|nr:hypothetical protein [Phyllobacterium sp. IY22]